MVNGYRDITCPQCGSEFSIPRTADHVICPDCTTDLTLIIQMSPE